MPQPPTPADAPTRLSALIETHRHRPGALLPLLQAVQAELGCVPDEAVPEIAAALNLSRAEVHGVITYYPLFRRQPAGRHRLQICRAEACRACGGEGLQALAEQLLGCAEHETRADGAVTLEPVYCLGLCAIAPALQLDERQHGRVTPERLRELLAGVVPGAEVPR